ncbi:hypothetical protein LIA77_02059 [Sarocladium implicatum]|nr:hypothetical protein LIA77_02059 [Sarocladium implicatum]
MLKVAAIWLDQHQCVILPLASRQELVKFYICTDHFIFHDCLPVCARAVQIPAKGIEQRGIAPQPGQRGYGVNLRPCRELKAVLYELISTIGNCDMDSQRISSMYACLRGYSCTFPLVGFIFASVPERWHSCKEVTSLR